MFILAVNMFVKSSLVFGFAFMGAFMVSGTWRQYLGHKRAPSGPNEAPLRLLPLLGFDKIIAKYALGLETDVEFEGVPLDLAEGYYEVFEVMEDPDFVAAQFTRSTILQLLRQRSDCKTVLVNRLLMVTVVNALQDELKPAIGNMRTTVEDILKDLSMEIKGPLFGRILTAFVASILQSSISGIVDQSIPIDGVAQLQYSITQIMRSTTSKGDFLDILDAIPLFSSPEPSCPTMEELSIIYSKEVPKIKEAFSENILRSIKTIRGELGLKGIPMDYFKPIEQLFEALNPIVGDVIDELMREIGICSTDLRRFFIDYGFELPETMTGVVPTGSTVFKDIKNEIEMLISVEGPLKELIKELTAAKM